MSEQSSRRGDHRRRRGGLRGAAYYLSEQRGIKATILEQRRAVASHASGFNAGGLNPLEGHGWPEPLAAHGAAVVQPAPGTVGSRCRARPASITTAGLIVDYSRWRWTLNDLPESPRRLMQIVQQRARAGLLGGVAGARGRAGAGAARHAGGHALAGVRAVGNGALDGLEFTAGPRRSAAQQRRRRRWSTPTAVGLRLGNGRSRSGRDRATDEIAVRGGAHRRRALVPLTPSHGWTSPYPWTR